MGKKQKVSDYVNNLDPASMTATTNHPLEENGTWRLTSTAKRGESLKYKVKLMEDASAIWSKDYDSQPSFTQIVNDVKSAKG
ncbi:hypothetical protein ACLX1H_010977 [Fusarium chlamydosporum]